MCSYYRGAGRLLDPLEEKKKVIPYSTGKNRIHKQHQIGSGTLSDEESELSLEIMESLPSQACI
jgi:hypothetical protein